MCRKQTRVRRLGRPRDYDDTAVGSAVKGMCRFASCPRRRRSRRHSFMARLSIPPKRFERRTVTFLTAEESQALIDAPDQLRWEGRRDRAMLILTIQAGLRVSELVGLGCGDVALGTGAHVRIEGNGRKQRAVPLTGQARAVLAVWLAERGGQSEDPLFPTRTGRRLSRDAVERRVWQPT